MAQPPGSRLPSAGARTSDGQGMRRGEAAECPWFDSGGSSPAEAVLKFEERRITELPSGTCLGLGYLTGCISPSEHFGHCKNSSPLAPIKGGQEALVSGID